MTALTNFEDLLPDEKFTMSPLAEFRQVSAASRNALEKGRFEEALSLLEEARRLHKRLYYWNSTEDFSLLIDIATAHNGLGQHSAARDVVTKALRQQGLQKWHKALFLFQNMRALKAEGELEEAESSALQARAYMTGDEWYYSADIKPETFFELHVMLAEILISQKKLDRKTIPKPRFTKSYWDASKSAAVAAAFYRPGDADPNQWISRYFDMKRSQPDVVYFFLSCTEIANVGLDSIQRYPIHEAVNHPNTEVLNLLLDFGFNMEAVSTRDVTPLLEAAKSDRETAARVLLKRGGLIDAIDEDGWTALMYAADRGSPGLVNLLLNHSADVTLRNAMGETALDIANTKRHVSIARTMIAFDKAQKHKDHRS